MARVAVRMLWDISGTRDMKTWPPHGKVKSLPSVEAAEIVALGAAYYVVQSVPPDPQLAREIHEAERES